MSGTLVAPLQGRALVYSAGPENVHAGMGSFEGVRTCAVIRPERPDMHVT